MAQSNLKFAAETLLNLFDNKLIPPFDQFEKVKDGLKEAIILSNDLEVLDQIKLARGEGTFINLIPNGKKRADDYQTLVGRITNPKIKKLLDMVKFKITANHVRTVIDTPEPGSADGKATFLLVHPGAKPDPDNPSDQLYTLIMAAGNSAGKTIKVGPVPQVLDEIDPCKSCSKVED